MKLGTQKTLEQLKLVLKDPQSNGPDPVYWVFNDVPWKGKKGNITIWAPGKIGEEYTKTFGHYHDAQINETYNVIAGEGIFQMMKKHFEGDRWDSSKVDVVYLVKAKPGDEVLITPEFGHSWSNTGDLPLITFDNWTSGHKPSDYADIEKLHGLAYYLIEENGEPKAVPNPNYKDLPEPIWITAEEFAKLDARR